MPRPQYILRTIVAIGVMLAFCSISPAALARGTGKPAPWVGKTFHGKECRGSRIPFGPYDYLQRDKHSGALFITEEYHLTPEILRLQQATTTSAINDIQYSLMAWPNHHKALYAAYQYRLKARGDWRQDANSATPVECHLQRAIKFSPSDPVPYMIQGLLLHDFEKYEKALQSFRKANQLLPNDVITLYNMGLTLVELEQYDEALQVAEEIYRTDFPLQGLKNKLVRAGQWGEKTTEDRVDSNSDETAPAEKVSNEEVPAEVNPAEKVSTEEISVETPEETPANVLLEATPEEEIASRNSVREESLSATD